MLYKKGVIKNPQNSRQKFMLTAASGIGENRPCLASCEIIDVLQK